MKQNNDKNIVNDIAIIFLPRPAELNLGVQLICLPHNPNEYRFATAIPLCQKHKILNCQHVTNIYCHSFRQELRLSNLVEDIVGKQPGYCMLCLHHGRPWPQEDGDEHH